MNRPGTIIYNSDLLEFKKQLKEATGFVFYEVQPGDQTTFYGTSDKFEEFKELVGDRFNTGSLAYIIDTAKKYCYSQYKNQWYSA